MSTATARSVFKLGEETRGNREGLVVESGDSYDVDVDTLTDYTDQDARWPYSL
jgi:hypothetical protein